MEIETFEGAIQAAEHAFRHQRHASFTVWIECAQSAIAEHPDLVAKLEEARNALPAQHALDLVAQVAAEVRERDSKRH